MHKTLSLIVLLGLGAYAAACLALLLFQRSLIYFPPPVAAYPVPASSTLDVPGAAVKISERPLAGGRALLYFGGNAEDVTASLPQLATAFPQHALYLLHYRGYAGSSGKPTEAALVADALALFDRVARRHKEIVVIGRSLGSGVAVQVASQRPVARLVLVTPFDSLQSLAAGQFPWFPVRWLLRDTYASIRYAPRVSAPTLIVAAAHDEFVPLPSSRRLAAGFAPGLATLRIIDGTGHHSISDNPDYLAALAWAR